MKKHKNEDKLLKLAMTLGQAYATKRGYGGLSQAESNKDKVEAIYRLLVNDKLISPLPADKEDGPNLKHRLVLWIVAQLPETHELLQ